MNKYIKNIEVHGNGKKFILGVADNISQKHIITRNINTKKFKYINYYRSIDYSLFGFYIEGAVYNIKHYLHVI